MRIDGPLPQQLAQFRVQLGERDAETIDTVFRLAEMLKDQKKLDEAETLLRETPVASAP